MPSIAGTHNLRSKILSLTDNSNTALFTTQANGFALVGTHIAIPQGGILTGNSSGAATLVYGSANGTFIVGDGTKASPTTWSAGVANFVAGTYHATISWTQGSQTARIPVILS